VRILIRTSRWASWARRLGSLSVPLAVIPVVLHRQGAVTSDAFTVVALVAAGVAALALLVALIALARLWHTGDRGWDRAFTGLFLAIVCLLPPAWFGLMLLRYPQATDISTAANRAALPLVFDLETAAMPPPKLLTPAALETVFPNVKTRSYPLDVVQLYGIVFAMAEDQGWDIRIDRPPAGALDEGRINARVMTLAGWREEVVLHLVGSADGSSLDMRSVSLNAQYDFGSNGTRIEGFLVALDEAVTTFLRDNPDIDQPVEDDAGGTAVPIPMSRPQ